MKKIKRKVYAASHAGPNRGICVKNAGGEQVVNWLGKGACRKRVQDRLDLWLLNKEMPALLSSEIYDSDLFLFLLETHVTH